MKIRRKEEEKQRTGEERKREERKTRLPRQKQKGRRLLNGIINDEVSPKIATMFSDGHYSVFRLFVRQLTWRIYNIVH